MFVIKMKINLDDGTFIVVYGVLFNCVLFKNNLIHLSVYGKKIMNVFLRAQLNPTDWTG